MLHVEYDVILVVPHYRTGIPNFDCILFLLQQCPEYLLVKDNRGFTPLEYAPKDTHYAWKDFLDTNQNMILQSLQQCLL